MVKREIYGGARIGQGGIEKEKRNGEKNAFYSSAVATDPWRDDQAELA